MTAQRTHLSDLTASSAHLSDLTALSTYLSDMTALSDHKSDMTALSTHLRYDSAKRPSLHIIANPWCILSPKLVVMTSSVLLPIIPIRLGQSLGSVTRIALLQICLPCLDFDFNEKERSPRPKGSVCKKMIKGHVSFYTPPS